MEIDAAALLHDLSTWSVPVLLAITLHEAAHAYVADWCGDETARRLGRVSLDPRKHIDPFGTLLLPGLLLLMHVPFLFGYARPVPIDARRLGRPRRDRMLVAAAGPAANLLQAIVALLLLEVVVQVDTTGWFAATLARAVTLNIALAAFNLLPIPPLDGAHIAIGLLPGNLSRPMKALMPHGMAILIGLAIVLPSIGVATGIDLDIVGRLLLAIVGPLTHGLNWLFG